MPAFDPVRDAVLNSPVTPAKPLPFRLDLPSNNFASPSPGPSGSDSASTAQSPLTRRATHLSMLLNDDPPQEPSSSHSQSLFTPTTPRGPASFSHLLHPDEPSPTINEQLAHAAPLQRRRPSVVERDSGSRDAGGYFPAPPARSPLAFPSGQEPSPSGAMHSADRASSSSRPSTTTPSDNEMPHERMPRRRSSGASDLFGGASAFTPTTSSPLALPGNVQEAQRSPSPARSRGSPTRPLATLPARAASPSNSASRPSTSGSAAMGRSESPAQRKRSDSRTFASMPPPPQPATPKAAPEEPRPTPPPAFTHSRSSVPYAPRNRITPPASVLVPLTREEIEKYKNFTGGLGTQMLKRKRKDSDAEEGDDRPVKRNRDVTIVAEHYNARPEVGLAQRRDSPIIGLKNFNNWVKSVLIISQAHPVVSKSEFTGTLFGSAGGGMRGPARGAGKVLEIGCGKGGDLIKWSKAKIKDFVGIDIASVSIDQARMRYAQLRPPKYTAYFTAADCYTRLLSDVLPENVLSPGAAPFDVVSLQFCMHYAFESEDKVRTMLTNVTKWMKPGGRFIGTVPNGKWLMDRLDGIPDDAKELEFGNSVYKIRFEQREPRPLYGHRYWFYLKDAVEDVPEYVVHWDSFVKLASEYDLDLIYEKEFHEVYAENEEHPEYGPMLQHMKVVDSNGESQMDEDQWEAANIYIAFAFEKRAR